MKCTLCKKSSSKLVTYRLCDCCSERVEHGCREAIFFVSNEQPTAAAAAVRKVECDICLEPVLKENLEQHRELCCVSRTVFRCTLCDADYQHKTGLWEHLTSHEILDESKEEHCQETEVVYDFHKCELCSDQRVYRENLYWNHIHEDHDGFFLKCRYCSENFRSRKLKAKHEEDCCKSQAKEDDYSGSETRSLSPHEMDIEREEQDHQSIEKENVISQDENHDDIPDKQLECSFVAQNSCPDCGITISKRTVTHRCRVEGTVRDEEIRPSVYTRKQCPNCKREFRKTTTYANHKCKKKAKVGKSGIGIPGNTESGNLQCPHCKRFYVSRKALVYHIRMLHKKAQCTICGLFLANYGLVKTHKLAVHTERIECPQCKKTFTKMTFQNHLNSHKKASHLCPECGVMFKSGQNLQVHLKRFHSPGKVPSMKEYIRKGKSKKRKVDEEVSVSEGAGTEDED